MTQIKGIYIRENELFARLTKELTLYVYSVSNSALERQVNVNFAYEIFNLKSCQWSTSKT